MQENVMAHCPYKGLIPFSEKDEQFFAGREREVKLTITSLYGAPLTVLYGESGVGKTSLIRAGVLPELGRSGNRVATVLYRNWQLPDFETNLRDEMLTSLLESLNRLRAVTKMPLLNLQRLREVFCEGLELKHPDDLYRLPFDRLVKECSAAFQGRLFFIFDQFEEYIYYHPLKLDGAAFDAAFARAVNDRSASGSFLLALREDGLGKLDRLRGRVPDLLGNLLRIDHLSREGAEQGIIKPLKKYSEDNNVVAEATPELIDALLEQINTERLEMDDVSDDRIDGGPEPDSGVRYKAVALQAILTRLWDKTQGSAESARDANSAKPVQLTLENLRQLAREKNKHETEARFIVRTYFDERLALLSEAESEYATEILRGLVRAGGHKRARTAEALSQESAVPLQTVESLLERLSQEPIALLRRLQVRGHTQYELHHDVMAFALMDWSNRQRQQKQQKEFAAAEARRLEQSRREQEEVATRQRLREKELEVQALEFTAAEKEQEEHVKQLQRRQKFALMQLSIAILAMVVIGSLVGLNISNRDKEVSKKEMHLMQEREWNRMVQRLIDQSLAYLGTANQFEFKPTTALLAAVDAIAEHRAANAKNGRSDIFVPSRAVLALVTAKEAISAKKMEDIPATRMYLQVPAVQTVDGKNQLALKTPSVVELKTDQSVREFALDNPVTKLGFDVRASRAGVSLKNGKVITWTLPELQRDEPKDTPLKTALNIDDESASAMWFRNGPEDGWTHGYSEMINEHLLTAIKAIIEPYPPVDRSQIGVPDDVVTVTDEINAAYKDIRDGQTPNAIATLEKALGRLSLDKAQAKPVLAANLFRYASEPPNAEMRDTYFKMVVDLDDSLKTNIEDFNKSEQRAKRQREAIALIESAKKLAAEEKSDEAQVKYKTAIDLDPSLKDKISLATLIEAGNQTKAISLMNEGNDLAKKGDRKAIEKYEAAIKLDPKLKDKVIPENEYKRFAEGSAGLPQPDQSPSPEGLR
jgi:tetratricopeptide (TPR) repeat protein